MDNDSIRVVCTAGGEEGGNVLPAIGKGRRPGGLHGGRADKKALRLEDRVKRGWPLQRADPLGGCRRKAQRTGHWRFNPRSS